MDLVEYTVRRLRLSDTKARIVRNLFWSVLGKVVTLAGSLLVGIIIARYLGPEKYGLMNYVISFVSLFQILALFGLDNIEIREESKSRYSFQTVLGTAFAIKMVMAVVALVLSVATAVLMRQDGYTVMLVAVYALSIIANTFSVCRNYFMAIVQNEYVVKSEILRTVVGVLIKVGLLLADAGLTWFIVAAMADYWILAYGYAMAYRKKVGPMAEWRFSRECAVYLVRESFPILITSAAVIIYQRIDQVMIGSLIGNADVGYFSVASRIVEIVIYVPTIIVQTVIPVLTRTRERSEDEYRQKALQFMGCTIWATMLVSVLVAACSYWAVLLLFGERYLSAVAILRILSFKAVFVAISSTAGNMIILEGRQKYVIIRDLVGCAVCVALNYVLLPVYGIVASAYIALLSNFTAGYLADFAIPAYRHIFRMQTRAIFIGWYDAAKMLKRK